jgi:PAS domain S-box-containing protein
MTPAAPHAVAAAIVESTSDAVLFADRDGLVRYWNRGAEELFGFRADEIVGRSMDVIIPERLRPRHWDGWRRVMETGTTRYGKELLAVPALRKDGSTISIEFSIALLRGPSGEILGPAAIVRDVTARFRREKELRARLAALEARLGVER